MEGEVRHQGSTLLLLTQRLPVDHQRIARRDPALAHLHGVPQQLPLDSRPHRRRILIQEIILIFYSH